jgi:ubiquinone biosynthesis protein
MFEKQQRKFKRSARLASVLAKYGFQDLLLRINVKVPSSTYKQTNNFGIYERVRMALEELGPTFVKLGQSFSDRDDLLPDELVAQLAHLQDRVVSQELDVEEILKQEFGEAAFLAFNDIDTKPIAAASIAQVYQATLQTGEKVIIKVKRPHVDDQIKDDLLILKDLVVLIDTYSDLAEQLNLKHAVLAFEKSLLEELSLTNEKNNILKFSENFKDSTETYVPKVYDQLCTDRVLTMEFVEGIKITNIASLDAHGIDKVHISEVGYRLFVSQILDFGIFHADPHAGNILVTKDQKLVFIDFGAVGRIPNIDKPYFDQLILSFVAKKANKIVRILKKLSLNYSIADERKFEMDVHEIFSYVHNSSLKDIDVATVMNKMKEVLKDNRLVMPAYFYLLFKGVSLMDGVGRKINPDLDVMNSLKPFTKKLMKERLSPQNLSKKAVDKATDLLDDIEEIPNGLRSILQKLEDNKFTVTTNLKQLDQLSNLMKIAITNLIIGLLMAASIIASALLFVNHYHLASGAVFILTLLMGLLLLLRMLRR